MPPDQDNLLQPHKDPYSLENILVHPSQLPKFTPQEALDLLQLLSNPVVKKYFAEISVNAAYDFLSNDPNTSEKKEMLIARFQQLKGVQHVCALIINGFRPPKPPQAPKEKGDKG